MHRIEVSHAFSAAHAIVIAGQREPLHGHDFRVTAAVESHPPHNLDTDGLLCDFHRVHAALAELCEPFTNQNLNDTPPFERLNPTAEHIARHLADALAATLDPELAPRARVAEVGITEAIGCRAVYRRPAPPDAKA